MSVGRTGPLVLVAVLLVTLAGLTGGAAGQSLDDIVDGDIGDIGDINELVGEEVLAGLEGETTHFAVTDVTTDLQPGSVTNASLTIENVDDETVENATLTVAGSGGVLIDAGSAAHVLGDVDPGDSHTVEVTATAQETVSPGQKPLIVAVEGETEDGNATSWTNESVPITVQERQEFAVSSLETTLSVGYDGTITGEIENQGPRTVADGVLAIAPGTESLVVGEPAYALPTLAPGESATFAFPTDVPGGAEPGPRQVQFFLEYGDTGEALRVGPVRERVVIGERVDEFGLAVEENTTLEAGGSTNYTMTITNQLPETVSNVDARLYPDGPISAPDDEAFVPELAPNETAEIAFRLASDAGATPEYHPVELDFQYDTEDGESVLSDLYVHPVEVHEPPPEEDDGIPSAVLVGGLLALGVASVGIVRWRRGAGDTDGEGGGSAGA